MLSCKKSLDFFLFSHIFIAICAFISSMGYHYYYLQAPDYVNASYVFFSTLFSYNFIELLSLKKDKLNTARGLFLNKHKEEISIITTISLVSSFILFFFLSKNQMALYLTLGIFVFLYRGLKKNSSFKARDFAIIKPFYISLIWLLVLFPVAHAKISLIHAFEFFIFMFSLCLAFDLRDIKIDFNNNLKTIAVRFGIENTIYLGYFLIITQLLLSMARGSSILFEIIIAVFYSILLFKMLNDQKNYYSYLGIDGLILLKISINFF